MTTTTATAPTYEGQVRVLAQLLHQSDLAGLPVLTSDSLMELQETISSDPVFGSVQGGLMRTLREGRTLAQRRALVALLADA